jgi:hypothetical protein
MGNTKGLVVAILLAASIISAQVVTLRNQTIYGGLTLNKPESVTVQNCSFEGGGIIIQGNWTNPPILIESSSFNNCYIAIQLVGVSNDPNVVIRHNQITGDQYTLKTDQINIYASSGMPGNPIRIYGNFIEACPDSPTVPYAGGIVIDLASNQVSVSGNTLLNADIALAYASSNTNIACSNTIVGVGIDSEFTAGMGIVPQAGYLIGNVVGWWNTLEGHQQDFFGGAGNGSVSLPRSMISMEEEQILYWRWANEMVAQGVSVGNGDAPAVTYPQAGDFPK